jgi:superfamily II DNA or RNA helicase
VLLFTRQAQVLEAVFTATNSVLVIMATAAGKTFCYTSPVLVLKKFVFVLVPFNALLEDLLERVSGVRWDGTRVVPRGPLVFLSPNDMRENELKFLFRELLNANQLLFLAIDEIHEWIFSSEVR